MKKEVMNESIRIALSNLMSVCFEKEMTFGKDIAIRFSPSALKKLNLEGTYHFGNLKYKFKV